MKKYNIVWSKYLSITISLIVILSALISVIVFANTNKNNITQNMEDIIVLKTECNAQNQEIDELKTSLAVIQTSIKNIEKQVDDMHKYMFNK